MGRHDGVVRRGENERFHADMGQPRRGVGLFVVIEFVSETIERRDDEAVEVVKGPRAPHPLDVDEAGVKLLETLGLLLHAAQQMPPVEIARNGIEHLRARGGFQAGGNAGGPAYARGYAIAALSEPLEQHVPPEGETRQQERPAEPLQYPSGHEAQVPRFPRSGRTLDSGSARRCTSGSSAPAPASRVSAPLPPRRARNGNRPSLPGRAGRGTSGRPARLHRVDPKNRRPENRRLAYPNARAASRPLGVFSGNIPKRSGDDAPGNTRPGGNGGVSIEALRFMPRA